MRAVPISKFEIVWLAWHWQQAGHWYPSDHYISQSHLTCPARKFQPRVSGKSLIGAPIFPKTLAQTDPEKRQQFLELKLRAVSDEDFPSCVS